LKDIAKRGIGKGKWFSKIRTKPLEGSEKEGKHL